MPQEVYTILNFDRKRTHQKIMEAIERGSASGDLSDEGVAYTKGVNYLDIKVGGDWVSFGLSPYGKLIISSSDSSKLRKARLKLRELIVGTDWVPDAQAYRDIEEVGTRELEENSTSGDKTNFFSVLERQRQTEHLIRDLVHEVENKEAEDEEIDDKWRRIREDVEETLIVLTPEMIEIMETIDLTKRYRNKVMLKVFLHRYRSNAHIERGRLFSQISSLSKPKRTVTLTTKQKAKHKLLKKETARCNQISKAMIAFMKDIDVWEGQPSKLLIALEEPRFVEAHKINTNAKEWPRSPIWLTRRLKEKEKDLENRGVRISTKRTKKSRIIKLSKTEKYRNTR